MRGFFGYGLLPLFLGYDSEKNAEVGDGSVVISTVS